MNKSLLILIAALMLMSLVSAQYQPSPPPASSLLQKSPQKTAQNVPTYTQVKVPGVTNSFDFSSPIALYGKFTHRFPISPAFKFNKDKDTLQFYADPPLTTISEIIREKVSGDVNAKYTINKKLALNLGVVSDILNDKLSYQTGAEFTFGNGAMVSMNIQEYSVGFRISLPGGSIPGFF